MAVSEKQKVRFGPFEVDLRSGELFRDGIRLKLQPQPIQVLGILLEHPGELVTREELRKRLWPEDTFVDFEQGLNTAIKKLRQALGDGAETPHYIETLPRRGYRFIAEVGTAPSVESSPKVITFPSPPEEGEKQTRVELPRRPKQPLFNIIFMAVIGLGVLALVLKIGYEKVFPEPPRIVATRQLTHTQVRKNLRYTSDCLLQTDGNRIYFNEFHAGMEWGLAQVSTNGGETSEIRDSLRTRMKCPLGISPSGSELLIESGYFWAVPVPAGTPRRLPIPRESDWAAWATDGETFFYTDNASKDLFRVAADGSKRTRLLSNAFTLTALRVSPDGRRIRYTVDRGSRKDIWEAAVDGSDPHPVFPELQGQTDYGDWTPDGKLFFFYRLNGASRTLWAVRENLGRFSFAKPKATLVYPGPLALYSLAFSKNSRELYVIGAMPSGELSVYDREQSRFISFLGGIQACCVSFSPDGHSLAYVSYPDGSLWKSRVDGSDKMQLTFPPVGAWLPRWSPDGKYIAFTDLFGSDHRAIYIVPASGGEPSLLLSNSVEPSDATWSPDSRSIAYSGEWNDANSNIQILDVNTLTSTKVPGSDAFFAPRWSPDGKYIAALKSGNANLWLYDFAVNNWRLLVGGAAVGYQTWSKDSKHVYYFDYSYSKLMRVNVETEMLDTILDFAGIQWTSFARSQVGWFDLTPDDRIMILRDTGSEEIYALQLEY